MFLDVTLLMKPKRFHINGSLSRKILFPAGGDFGRSICAGELRIKRRHAANVTAKTVPEEAVIAIRLITTGIEVSIGGMTYIVEYAPEIMSGKAVLPEKTPSKPPKKLALKAYSRYFAIILSGRYPKAIKTPI